MPNKNLNILVLLRETNDPRPPARLMTRGAGISERGLRRIPNPADLTALEQALQLKKRHNANVTVLASGPDRLDDLLRLAASMGADRCIRFHDHGVEGGDAVADARILARFIDILTPALLLAGNRLADRGDDPVPSLAAALRNTSCIGAVTSLTMTAGGVVAIRKVDRGGRQKVTAAIPAVVLFEEAELSLYPDINDVTAALETPIEKWDLSNLGIPLWDVGPTGAALPLAEYGVPRHDPVRVVTPDATLPAFERIISLLSGGIKAREGRQHTLGPDEAAERLWQILLEEGVAS
jgi:electron transfer flavoprotein beta subunit